MFLEKDVSLGDLRQRDIRVLRSSASLRSCGVGEPIKWTPKCWRPEWQGAQWSRKDLRWSEVAVVRDGSVYGIMRNSDGIAEFQDLFAFTTRALQEFHAIYTEKNRDKAFGAWSDFVNDCKHSNDVLEGASTGLAQAHDVGEDRIRVRMTENGFEVEYTPLGDSKPLYVKPTTYADFQHSYPHSTLKSGGVMDCALARWTGGVGPWCGVFVGDDENLGEDDWNYGVSFPKISQDGVA